MIGSRLLYLLAALVIIFTRIVSVAQVSSGSNPVVQPPPLPLTSQIKKTIAFLSTTCLHDYSAEADALSIESLQKMPIQQEFTIAQQLIALTLRLQNVRQSMAKLTADDIAHLKQNVALTDSSAIAAEALWRAQVLVKMTSLTAEDIASLKPEEIPLIPSNEFLGTGFFVKVSDGRIKGPEGVDKANLGFTYLVTNRHVVQPGVEKGKPCQVLGSAIVLNRKPDTTHSSLYAETSRIDKILKWTYSDDDSVDLAVSGIGVPPDLYDYVTIPTIQFITDEEVQKKIVVEGDPVLFSGLFIQSFSEVHRLEPIVRSGTLAMVPEGVLDTTLNRKPGHLYLAEAHAFGGNSGSPMFIDTNKFANIIGGPSYKFLGVISGEVLENADLTLNVTTSFAANIGANSDVSTVVPARELLKILNGKELQNERDAIIAKQSGSSQGTPKSTTN
jgi:hypothetical protein